MNTTTSQTAKWAATAEVAPRAGNTLLGAATGAYVPVLGVARSMQAFRYGVERAMRALDFDLVSLDEVRQIQSSSDIASFDEVLRDRLDALHEGNPVEFGSFHSFTEPRH